MKLSSLTTISETFWRSLSDNVLRKYNYGYDALNRLRQAVYEKPDSDVPNSYGEALSYDKNGNIMSLQRNGNLDDYFMTVQIDDLSYAYANNSNQLLKVTDGTNNINGFKDDSDGTNDNDDDYRYDDNGNMLFDQNKGITEIVYNHLNLPTKIIFEATGEITYIYNAMGQKVEKLVVQNGCDTCYNGQSIVKTDYLDGFQYKNAVLQFFPTAEGYVNYFKENFNYVYNYTDHLGNIRLSYGIDPKTLTLKIIEENHYYPFGLKHSSYNTSLKGFKEVIDNGVADLDPTGKPKLALKQIGGTGVVEKGFNYKYNGKELQEELGLNVYDYGARNYDVALGRWMNIDPLAENYLNMTPYNYAANNPIVFLDPNGKEIYMFFSVSGHENKEDDRMFWEAAMTRAMDFLKSDQYSSKDILVIGTIEDLGSLKGEVEGIVNKHSDKYGKTKEFGIWSHASLDGPVGAKNTSKNALDDKQMTMNGWEDINFNWSKNGAMAGFYGCRTGVEKNEGSDDAFSTRVSGLKNFKNVLTLGQQSYSYPSIYTNGRRPSNDQINGNPGYPTYMVAGQTRGISGLMNDFRNTVFDTYPMRASVNGSTIGEMYQFGKKHKK